MCLLVRATPTRQSRVPPVSPAPRLVRGLYGLVGMDAGCAVARCAATPRGVLHICISNTHRSTWRPLLSTGAATAGGRGGDEGGPLPEELVTRRFRLRASKVSRYMYVGHQQPPREGNACGTCSCGLGCAWPQQCLGGVAARPLFARQEGGHVQQPWSCSP